jgi:hypothetical protein
MSKLLFTIWAWGSTFLFAGVLLWFASTPNLSAANPGEEALKVAFRMLLYAVFFLLVYRSILTTIRNTVRRLSGWHSKREANEDAEFALIIETLIVIVTILATTVFAIFDEYVQAAGVDGRQGEPKDVLVSVMAIILTALVVYTMPVVGELEVAIKHKYMAERDFIRRKLSPSKAKN